MNCFKAESKSVDGQCVRVITNCKLKLISASLIIFSPYKSNDG